MRTALRLSATRALVAAVVVFAGADSGPRRVPRFVVDRAGGGHTGSNWLASLLSGAGLVSVFQFGGVCDPSTTKRTGDLHAARVGLRKLLKSGCACMPAMEPGWPMRCTASKYEGCLRTPYCLEKCAERNMNPEREVGCKGIGVVAPPIATTDLMWELTKDMGASGDWGSRVSYVAWLRDNAVKQATSVLKASNCGLYDGFRNHEKVSVEGILPLMHAEPRRLLSYALHHLEHNHDFLGRVRHLQGAYEAHYEDFQLNETGQLDRLLKFVGVPEEDLPAKPPAATLKKATHDSLAEVLVNFKEIEDSFLQWNATCLHSMLLADAPRRFSCAPDPRPDFFDSFLRKYGATDEDVTRRPYVLDCTLKECISEGCGRNFSPAERKICFAARRIADRIGERDAAVQAGKTRDIRVCVLP